jgi:hypothetical protein
MIKICKHYGTIIIFETIDCPYYDFEEELIEKVNKIEDLEKEIMDLKEENEKLIERKDY